MTGVRGLVVVSLALLVAIVPARAQPLAPGENLLDYLVPRTVFIRMMCLPDLAAIDPGADTAVVTPPSERIAWASGTVIRRDGYVMTALHALKDLVYSVERGPQGGRYSEVCTEDDIKIELFTMENLHDATRVPVRRTYAEATVQGVPVGRVPVENADVLLFKANVFGVNNRRYICPRTSPPLLGAADYATEPDIFAGAVAIIQGTPHFDRWEGRASADFGLGDAANFLRMTMLALDGMSGAAVVDENGLVVGMVRGRLDSAGQNYFVPFYLFDDEYRDYADAGCAALTPPPAPAVAGSFAAESARVLIALAGSGPGFNAGQRTVTDLAVRATLEEFGEERSECNDGFNRAFSSARAEGQVLEHPRLDGLAFNYTLDARGGHYVTSTFGCAGGQFLGLNGNDTFTEATLELSGRARFNMPEAGRIRLEWQGLPAAGASITLRSPLGATVPLDIAGFVSGTGGVDVDLAATTGDATYVLEIAVADGVRAEGATGQARVAADAAVWIVRVP